MLEKSPEFCSGFCSGCRRARARALRRIFTQEWKPGWLCADLFDGCKQTTQETTFIRPCIDCGQRTGSWCDTGDPNRIYLATSKELWAACCKCYVVAATLLSLPLHVPLLALPPGDSRDKLITFIYEHMVLANTLQSLARRLDRYLIRDVRAPR